MRQSKSEPESLVAVIVAARRVKNQDVEDEAKRQLEVNYGVKLSFTKPTRRRESRPCTSR